MAYLTVIKNFLESSEFLLSITKFLVQKNEKVSRRRFFVSSKNVLWKIL